VRALAHRTSSIWLRWTGTAHHLRFDRFEELHDPGQPPAGQPATSRLPARGQPGRLLRTRLERRSRAARPCSWFTRTVNPQSRPPSPGRHHHRGRLGGPGRLALEAHEHFEELGFDTAAREVLRRNPNLLPLVANRSATELSWGRFMVTGPHQFLSYSAESLVRCGRPGVSSGQHHLGCARGQHHRIVGQGRRARLGLAPPVPALTAATPRGGWAWIIGQHHAI